MKKAFTLIELLAVLIILGVILAIIIPVTNGVINNSKQNAYDTQIEMLLDQALKYSVNNNLGTSSETKSIQFQDLINNGLISELPTNPKTSEQLQGCITYSWQTSINQYKFEYSESCDVPQITYNKMVSGHDFNIKVTAMSGFDTVTRIVFESTIDEGLDLNSTIDLSLNQDNSIVGFISGNTLKIQNNGVILAHEDLGITFNADGSDAEKISMFMMMTNITEINFNDNGANAFDTSNVTNMSYMFGGASVTSLDLSSFDTSKVTNMSGMFIMTGALTNLDLSSFDTSNVTNMKEMFSYASSLTNLYLSSFNTSKVTDMSFMFNNASSLKSLDLSSFNTSNVIDMSNMFYLLDSIQKPIITRNQEELNRYESLSGKEECNFITITDYNNLTEQERNDLTFTNRCSIGG